MTFNPRTLQELGAYWTAQEGVNLGVVGNQRHCRGYHLGKDRIYSTCACKPDGTCEPGKRDADYSVQTARDKAGLTNAASAIDLGKLGGSLSNLYRFSSWLARQCLANEPGTGDIREVIYSPDGKRVLGYKDGVSFLIADYGDDSHLTHTHVSYYRDSEHRDKRPVFARYFDLPDTDTETPDMPGLTVTRIERFAGSVTPKTPGTMAVRVSDKARVAVPLNVPKPAVYRGQLVPPLDDEPGDRSTVYGVGDTEAVLLAMDVEVVEDKPVDCSGAVAAEHERTRAAAIAAVEAI